MSVSFRLDGKEAIVTGGAKGIGREIALSLANAGAEVAIWDVNLGGAEETAQKIMNDTDKEAIAMKVDVTSALQVDKMTKKVIEKFGRIDILVNNAGTNKRIPAENLSEEIWHQIINTNLTSVFLCSQAIGRHMIRQKKGNIINISSICSQVVNKSIAQSAYHASKAGVSMLTKALAMEWVEYNIRVNAICPGWTKTPLVTKYLENEDNRELVLSFVPMGRIQEPKELTGTVVFLASDASSFITGQEIFVDGGYTCW